MSKFPTGPAHPHVKASSGGEANLMKFYATTSATSSSHYENFQPRGGRHVGTGYLANFRPCVQYRSRLDEVDNPAMGRLVAGNYRTVFQRDFNPYGTPSGREALPLAAHQVPTGFTRERAVTVPDLATVQKQFIDSRLAAKPGRIGVQPPRKPLLHRLKQRDPIGEENAGYGPRATVSEYRTRYQGQPWPSVDLSACDVGPKETSGFSSNVKLNEPVLHTEHSPHRNDRPGWMTHRPTGVSEYTTGYRELEVPNGREALPWLAERASRDSGFTSGTVLLPAFAHRRMQDAYDKAGELPEARVNRIAKDNPMEFINVNQPNNFSSVSRNLYQGKQCPDQTDADRIGNTRVGFKEPSGHVSNDDSYVYKPDSRARFLTNYTTQFLDTTPHGKDREGHVAFNVLPAQADGFTKSTKTHFNKDFQAGRLVQSMDPYQAKSLVSRDRFFDDHTYDSKLHPTSLAA